MAGDIVDPLLQYPGLVGMAVLAVAQLRVQFCGPGGQLVFAGTGTLLLFQLPGCMVALQPGEPGLPSVPGRSKKTPSVSARQIMS